MINLSNNGVKVAINDANDMLTLTEIKDLLNQQNYLRTNSEINNSFIWDHNLLLNYKQLFADGASNNHILNNLDVFYDQSNLTDIINNATGDILGLANYTTPIYYPVNQLIRFPIKNASRLGELKDFFIHTLRNKLNNNTFADSVQNENITLNTANHYKKMLAEAMLYSIMLNNALIKHDNYNNKVYRITDLTDGDLASYQNSLTGNIIEADFGVTSTEYGLEGADKYIREYQKYLFEITPRLKNSANRILNGKLKDGSTGVDNKHEEEVLFLPGFSYKINNIKPDDASSKYKYKNDNNTFKNRTIIEITETPINDFSCFKTKAINDLIDGIKKKPQDHVITINSHGGFTDDKFILPNDVYVIIPHPNGLDINYTLPDTAFEPYMYKDGKCMLPKTTAGGYKLYAPGDQIRNLKLYPWSNHNKQQQYQTWINNSHFLAKNTGLVDASNIPNFAEVFANHDSKKIKLFANTSLKDIVTHFSLNSYKPIVIIPLSCNAKSDGTDFKNKVIIDPDNNNYKIFDRDILDVLKQ